MHTALVATSQTIADFLRHRFESDASLAALFRPGRKVSVSLKSPRDLTAQQFQGLSVWLYRIEADAALRNRKPPRGDGESMQVYGLPLRLHYVITPIVRTGEPSGAEIQQTLLGKALQALNDHPVFAGQDLKGAFGGTATEFRVQLESLSLEEIMRVWSALDQPMMLSAFCEVIGVAIMPEERPQSKSGRLERTKPV